MSDYALDSFEGAIRIVRFYNRGTASDFETQLIELFRRADSTMYARLATAFPAMAGALKYDAKYGAENWEGALP